MHGNYLIIYDISSNKRRNKIFKLLKGYGYNVQKSAFEINTSKQKIEKLIEDIKKILDSKFDNLRIYKMYDTNENKILGEVPYKQINDVCII